MSMQNWADLIQVAAGGIFFGHGLAVGHPFLATAGFLLMAFSAYLLQDDIKSDKRRNAYIAQFQDHP